MGAGVICTTAWFGRAALSSRGHDRVFRAAGNMKGLSVGPNEGRAQRPKSAMVVRNTLLQSAANVVHIAAGVWGGSYFVLSTVGGVRKAIPPVQSCGQDADAQIKRFTHADRKAADTQFSILVMAAAWLLLAWTGNNELSGIMATIMGTCASTTLVPALSVKWQVLHDLDRRNGPAEVDEMAGQRGIRRITRLLPRHKRSGSR